MTVHIFTRRDRTETTGHRYSVRHPAVRAAARRAGCDARTWIREQQRAGGSSSSGSPAA